MAARVKMYKGRVTAALAVASHKAKVEVGTAIERRAKELLSVGGGSGHEPSEPGEPPHLQTGALRSSVAMAIDTGGAVIVGPTEKYGAVHEYGSRLHPARPFMRPALMDVKGDLSDYFGDIL